MTEASLGCVLIAEDDRSVRESLGRAMRFAGYDLLFASDGAQALEMISPESPDLVLLDIGLPYVDGLSVCRTVRQRGVSTPILMLTARHEISDRVVGLDAGADDYLVKPFALDELMARVRALLRRNDVSVDGGAISVGDLSLDLDARTVLCDGVRLDLTKTEFDLLALLMENAGIVLERSVIFERIWGFDFETDSKSLDVYIGYLRRKLEADGASRVIHTVRGVGYVLREP
jgi:two-component system, OmpR family, response regulator MprA